jgi:hypothetical protein
LANMSLGWGHVGVSHVSAMPKYLGRVPRAAPSGKLEPVRPVPTRGVLARALRREQPRGPAERSRQGVQLRQLLRDTCSPLLDLSPFAEVAFGQNRTRGRHLQARPFGDTEPAGIEGTEEDAVVSRMDGRLEPANLPWLESRVPVHSFGVAGLGAKWTTTEQPHRPLRQEVPVVPHERRSVPQPVCRVSGAADDEPS